MSFQHYEWYEFEFCGLDFEVSAWIDPEVPAKINADPDDCYPASGGIMDIADIQVGGQEVDGVLYDMLVSSDAFNNKLLSQA